VPARVLNICAAKIGEKLGKQRLIEGLRAFGFGEKTALGLPVKARGALADPRGCADRRQHHRVRPGHERHRNPDRGAMAAIANGGVILRPYLVQSVIGPTCRPAVPGRRSPRVLAEDTARR